MSRFAVVGNPILHSKSPLMFEAAYCSSYPYLRILAQSTKEVLDLFSALDLKGINVTSPFKDVSLWGDGFLSPEVALLGFTNTIIYKNQQFSFFNTDIDGVAGSVDDVTGRTCVVLGAGGAGAAAAYALVQKKGEVTIVNRTAEKAEKIARLIGCDYCDFSELESVVKRSSIIINTLNVNVIDKEWLNKSQTVIDAIYHHSPLEHCMANYIDGSKWLVGQGVSSYRLFTGVEPDRKAMENSLIHNNIVNSIALIGKIKDGKKIARVISDRLGENVEWYDDCESRDFSFHKKNSIVVWLFSQSDESEESKKQFVSLASMVLNASFHTTEQLIDIIYGEISKTLCH